MDFINKLINRPKSLPASTATSMASDLEIESLLAEIQENLHNKNQNQNNTSSPGISSAKVQTPTSAGPETTKLTTSNITKNQSPSKCDTPNSSKKFANHPIKQKPHENFRNAFLLDDDKILPEELPDIVKVNPLPKQVIAAQSVCDSPTTAALKAFENLNFNSPPVSVPVNNPTSSTEHSDEEFTECQSYSALNATNTQNWQHKTLNDDQDVSDQTPPDSTTKSANTTQEIVSDNTLSLNLNKSFPVNKTPQKSTFPVSPTPDEDIKDYKLSEEKVQEEKKLEVPLDPPEVLTPTPSSFEKEPVKRISFPSTPEAKVEENKNEFPRAPTPDENERQSIATLNGTFAASSEALNSTININQEKQESFEEEDGKIAAINSTASFMSANATMPIQKVDSGFSSANMEENQNITSASFESANQTLNMEVNTTIPMNPTSSVDTTVPVIEDDCLNVTTSCEKMNSTTTFENVAFQSENDSLNVTTSGIQETVPDCVDSENIKTCDEKENLQASEVNTTTSLHNPVNLHDSMSMDVDMEEVEDNCQEMNDKVNTDGPMEVEDFEMLEPAAFQKFNSQIEFLSDKEKHNTESEKAEKENLATLPGASDFQSTDFEKNVNSEVPADDEFRATPGVIFDPSAFDFLERKGQKEEEVDIRRTSLLLKFDPLCQQLQTDKPKTTSILNDLKEEESIPENEVVAPLLKLNQTIPALPASPGIQITTKSVKKNEKMSVGVIQDMPMENNDIKSFENLSPQINEKQMKMDDEPENKAKNEVSRNEDVEKKLKDSEQREEALLKRITEKDKTIAKMTGVIEAYEKAIAELIAEKEQLSQNFEKELSDVKADRDTNYYHLTSLETTFSDLNIKYEKNKELLSQVKASEEKLLAERKVNGENLKLQEQRYEKMKTHAMMQLEIANQKIEDYRKQHTIETTRLKALLKKEEISRAAVSDQLQQKAKENEQLMKICDELINSQQPS